MNRYYVNKYAEENGFHLVHRTNCILMVGLDNRIDLGSFEYSSQALESAKVHYRKSLACLFCKDK